jgi:hypothetical protein
MKRYKTGLVVFDTIDIICISFSTGSGIALLIRKYRKYRNKRNQDPIVLELKKKVPLIMFCESGKPLKLPLVRGGDDLKKFSLYIKNKKLAVLIRAIFDAKRKQRRLRLLQLCFVTLNRLLTTKVGLCFAVGGSLDCTQFILIALPSTVAGLVMGLSIANPLASFLFSLMMLHARGIEDIADPYEKCKTICKVAEEFHNKQLIIQMEKLNPLVENTSTALDKVHLLCVEDKLSLLQRYKLTALIKNNKAQNRVQHFSEFIKKFPECDANPKTVYEHIVEKIEE